MKTPVSAFFSQPPPDSPDCLLDELARLAALIADTALASGEPEPLALVRLAPGLSMEQWRKLAADPACEGWFALNLKKENFPGLAQLFHATKVHSHHDATTSALCEASFLERLTEEISRANRTKGTLGLLLFELSDLARLNECSGTACGDAALRTLGTNLWGAVQSQDFLGRLGAQRLALALPGAGRYQCLALAERVVEDVLNHLGTSPSGADHYAGLRAAVVEYVPQPLAGRTALTDSHNLVDQAIAALQLANGAASATLRERVRLFRPQDCHDKHTQVLASEKHFLFFGSRLDTGTTHE